MALNILHKDVKARVTYYQMINDVGIDIVPATWAVESQNALSVAQSYQRLSQASHFADQSQELFVVRRSHRQAMNQ
jgi:hypothetical protein